MEKLRLKDLSLQGQRVLMRVDFNVPLDSKGQITDDSRIRAALPSIEYVLKQGASVVLMSHLGRPKSKDPKLSLAPCAKRLSELLKKPVPLAPDCIGPSVEEMAQNLKSGHLLMLENLRFHPGEESPEKEPSFVSMLAKLGTVYVNDAFGAAHRAHASTSLIASAFPQKAAAGFLMEKEIEHLSPLLHPSKHPFCAIMGGAKISSKIGVIENLLKQIDALFLGGGMAFTFFKAQGVPVGKSPVEEAELHTAKRLLEEHGKKIHLPSDLVIADAFNNEAKTEIVPAAQGIPEGWQGVDIGPDTVSKWANELKKAALVFWNGPLGVFEMPRFAAGTRAIAETLAHGPAQTIVGGGDSVAAIQQMGLSGQFAHLSTGGGASLEFLEFGHLPGIDALSDKK